MKVFSGFPPGKLQVTPLPNLFFSELVPAIEDLAELKLTLHIFWLIAHKKNQAPYISASELHSDRTLMRSLAAAGGEPKEALTQALGLAVERGTLLSLKRADECLYFLNTESGRRTLERLESGGEGVRQGSTQSDASGADARPNIFTLYEQNIGLLTPMISEELKEAEQQYPGEWIPEAFRLAVENNKRSWSYVRKILERWKTEGRSDGDKKRKPWYGDEYGKFVKR